MKIAFLDQLDSFSFNIIRYLSEANPSASIHVFTPNAAADIFACEDFDVVVIGPGPGSPQDYPYIFATLERWQNQIPILGICLGFQAINEYFGGDTIPAPEPVHGKTSLLKHDSQDLFQNLKNPLVVARYHSLQISPAAAMQITASVDGVPMAGKIRDKKIYGVQFHPESFLSQDGLKFFQNFFERLC